MSYDVTKILSLTKFCQKNASQEKTTVSEKMKISQIVFKKFQKTTFVCRNRS